MELRTRGSFLCLGITLTLIGCLISAAAIAMPGWQILDLPELNAVHEHAIFYDCILSEVGQGFFPLLFHFASFWFLVTPLNALRRARDVSRPVSPERRCTYKFATATPWETAFVRLAIEEGDFAAREHLQLHRFLPQHKAIIFFCVFTVLFALLSALVGACSACFVPNGILHVVSVGLATSCSLLADVLFFTASQREGNRRVQGELGTYQQHLSYAFFIHCLGSLTLVLALLCSLVAAYLLLAKQYQTWRQDKRQTVAAENAANNVEKCVFLSEVLSLRSRLDTDESAGVAAEQLSPPPPTPQQQQLRLSVRSATGRYRGQNNERWTGRTEIVPTTFSDYSSVISPKGSGASVIV